MAGKNLPGLTENQLTTAVLRSMRREAWKTHHMVDSRSAHWNADSKGFPDILALRGNRMVVVELKVGRNKPTDAQLDWLRAFKALNGLTEVYVWTPEDLMNGSIDEALKRR